MIKPVSFSQDMILRGSEALRDAIMLGKVDIIVTTRRILEAAIRREGDAMELISPTSESRIAAVATRAARRAVEAEEQV